MTEYRVVRGDRWWAFSLGFGRIQKARWISFNALPEKVKRAQVANPDLGAEEAVKMLTPEENVAYGNEVVLATLRLVLDGASDWNRGTTTADAYIDKVLPEDVAIEIYDVVQKVVVSTELDPESKKN